MEWLNATWDVVSGWFELKSGGVLSFSGQLIFAFIGGGIVSTFISERWNRKNARNSLVLERTSTVVRAYYAYIRMLRQKPEFFSETEFNTNHVNFLAEARILSFDPLLKKESEALRALSTKMANLRVSPGTAKNRKLAINSFFFEFEKILDCILCKVTKQPSGFWQNSSKHNKNYEPST